MNSEKLKKWKEYIHKVLNNAYRAFRVLKINFLCEIFITIFSNKKQNFLTMHSKFLALIVENDRNKND